jgi:hypothetical protein
MKRPVFCAFAFFTLPSTFMEQPEGSLPCLQYTSSDHRPALKLLTKPLGWSLLRTGFMCTNYLKS